MGLNCPTRASSSLDTSSYMLVGIALHVCLQLSTSPIPRAGLLQGATRMCRTFPEMAGRRREEIKEGEKGKKKEEGMRVKR